MSSPQNSILIPFLSFIPISTIPPLIENCPLVSTKSCLSYPILSKFSFTFSNEYVIPTFNFISLLYKSSFRIIFCIIASIVVITISTLFSLILFNTSILSYGKSLLSAKKS